MLQHIPKGLPSYSMLWEGIGKPHPTSLAKALGVDVRTVYRWMADDQAPRCPSLAMYWLTPWGLSRLDGHTVDTARLHLAMYQAQKAANKAQAHELARAQALASFHARHAPAAANGTAWPVVEPVRTIRLV